jgi:transmembrane sensor
LDDEADLDDSGRASSDLRMEALAHLLRLRSGRATADDAARFLAWRARGAAHERALRDALRLQDRVRQVEAEDGAGNVVRLGPRAVTRRMVMRGALAASGVGAAVLAGQSIDLIPPASAMRADVRTGPGERREVALPGGARATLNTRTSIALDGAAVELIAGELLLEARGAPARLRAGAGACLVDGRVNLRRDGDAVEATCLAGRAAVAWGGARRPLGAGETVSYDDAGVGAVRADRDPAATIAWRSGTLIFRDMPFAHVVAEINRYRPGRVLLAGDALAARRLTGTYDVARLDDFFGQAQLAFGARVTRLPAGVVILS